MVLINISIFLMTSPVSREWFAPSSVWTGMPLSVQAFRITSAIYNYSIL